MTLSPSIRQEAATLSARLPNLVIAARNVAQTVRHGVHGRRRAGSGETFWQFRPFISGEPSARVDWRRSARGEHAYVREREWEAAHTVWIWFDRSASMRFGSSLAQTTKIDRAAVIALAFADLCVRGGERAGLLGLTRPIADVGVVERFAEAIATDERLNGPSESALPPPFPAPARSMTLLVGDFLGEPERTEQTIRSIGARGGDRRTRDGRRSRRGDLPVFGQCRVFPSGRKPAASTPRGADHSRGLPRQARGAPREAPSLLREPGLGYEPQSNQRIGGGTSAGAAHAPFGPGSRSGVRGRLTSVRLSAHFRRARRPGDARRTRRASISSCG